MGRASLLALVTALVAGACQATPEEATVRSEYLMQSLLLARERADTAVIEEIFWPDARWDDYAGQIEYDGIDEIVMYATSTHEWGDDVYLNAGAIHSSPLGATAEWTLAAVQNRPVLELTDAVTGRELLLNGVTIIEVEGGRIIRAADYSDRAAMMLQLGARIELPDGTVLDGDELQY